MYALGQGVPRDDGKAVAWYRKAAEQGHARAQNDLGSMYYNGQGVPQNLVIAYALYNLAAANDPSVQGAARNREMASDAMTPSQLEAGERLTIELMKPGNFLKALDAATGMR